MPRSAADSPTVIALAEALQQFQAEGTCFNEVAARLSRVQEPGAEVGAT